MSLLRAQNGGKRRINPERREALPRKRGRSSVIFLLVFQINNIISARMSITNHKSFVSYGSCISILESANLLCGNFPQAVHGTSVPPHYKEVPLFFANKLLVIKLDLGHFPEQQY